MRAKKSEFTAWLCVGRMAEPKLFGFTFKVCKISSILLQIFAKTWDRNNRKSCPQNQDDIFSLSVFHSFGDIDNRDFCFSSNIIARARLLLSCGAQNIRKILKYFCSDIMAWLCSSKHEGKQTSCSSCRVTGLKKKSIWSLTIRGPIFIFF